MSASVTLLRSAVGSTGLERLASGIQWGAASPLPGGRILAAVLIVGQSRVVAIATGKDPAPLLETAEESRGPLAMLGRDHVLLVIGSPPSQSLAIVSLAEDRLVRRLEHVDGGAIQAVAGSPDGKTVYYAAGDVVWAVEAAGGTPRKLHAGNGVAIDPGIRYAVISLNEQAGVRLVRVPLNGEAGQEIPSAPTDSGSRHPRLCRMRWTPTAASSCGSRRQIPGSTRWEFRSAQGDLVKVWPDIETDMFGGWTDDGRVLAGSRATQSVLWRFARAK